MESGALPAVGMIRTLAIAAGTLFILSAIGLDEVKGKQYLCTAFVALWFFDISGSYKLYSFSNTNSPFPKTFAQLYPSLQLKFLFGMEDAHSSRTVAPNITSSSATNIANWSIGGLEIKKCENLRDPKLINENKFEFCNVENYARGNNIR